MSPFCLLTLLSSKYDLLNSVDAASHGTGQINTDTQRKLECVVPENDVVDAFNRVVDPVSERLRINDEQLFVLAQLRDALLPKLLSGEISVADTEKIVGDVT